MRTSKSMAIRGVHSYRDQINNICRKAYSQTLQAYISVTVSEENNDKGNSIEEPNKINNKDIKLNNKNKSYLQYFSDARLKEKNKAWKKHKTLFERENESWLKLEKYVPYLSDTACDVSTQLLSPEVQMLLLDPSKINDLLRKIVCSKDIFRTIN